MNNKKLKVLLILGIITIIAIISINSTPELEKESYAIDSSIDPTTWTYVDGLGRTGTTNINKNSKKIVGIFYWPWHLKIHNEGNKGPFNITEIMASHPEAKNDYNHYVWQTSRYHWWNEPIYGYYKEDDDYVLRKQAELLADAGVDFIAFDCTNGSYTWESAYENVLKVWLEAHNNGVNVPKIVFMLPFRYSSSTSAASLRQIYNNLYDPNSDNYQKYHDLFFQYNGKPLILMNRDGESISSEINNILNNFTVRENHPDYFTSGSQPHGWWGWLSTYPQAYYKSASGNSIEQTSVSVAQNANYANNQITAMNGENVMGRSYAKDNYSYSYKYRNQTITVGNSISGSTAKDTNKSLYGRNFQQQWDNAISKNPEVIFVTGWNEWIAMRHSKWPESYTNETTNAFPDLFNDEYSRDIEPSKGELKDYYYYQLVDNIRKFKGTSTQQSQDTAVTINNTSDWNNSSIISYNHYVGGKNRDITGFGTTSPQRYVNNTFRNDIKTAKVSYDKSYIYFYVQTVNNLTSSSDKNWMRLLIDTTNSINSTSTENWEEFEYIVNRNTATSNKMTVEKSTGGWNFKTIGTIDYTVSGNVLQLKIPRSYLGLTESNISFNFKWCDNNLDNGDIMTVYTDGDSAPGGRFAFQFLGNEEYQEIVTPPSEDDPTPPNEDDPTPPSEDDPTPPNEDDPTPPSEDEPEKPNKENNKIENITSSPGTGSTFIISVIIIFIISVITIVVLIPKINKNKNNL